MNTPWCFGKLAIISTEVANHPQTPTMKERPKKDEHEDHEEHLRKEKPQQIKANEVNNTEAGSRCNEE